MRRLAAAWPPSVPSSSSSSSSPVSALLFVAHNSGASSSLVRSSSRPLISAASVSASCMGSTSTSRVWARGVHDYIRGTTSGGTYKIPLSSPKIVGVCSSRGSRPYQEDATSVHALSLDPGEIKRSLASAKGSRNGKEREKGVDAEWDPSKSGSAFMASQTAFFGIYDGHGGKDVSAFLRDQLHARIESVTADQIESAVQATMAHGGYFRRWRGGALERFVPASMFEKGRGEKSTGREEEGDEDAEEGEVENSTRGEAREGAKGTESESGQSPSTGSRTGEEAIMNLEERLTLAFLETDKEVRETIGDRAERMGSTASVVLLNSLDEPAQPYWSSKKLQITVAHCGDTRVLLCDRRDGRAIPLTDRHHAEARVEAARLRRMGAERIVADSFGETRWMGAIENTRGFGDFEYKSSGVTAEPEVTSLVVDGSDHAYLVLVTDGLTTLLSDQELVDLARNSSDPTRAAKTIVHFGEDLGATDNVTCVVVPLAGWGQVGGEDTTEERREYRKRQAGMVSTRMQRM